MREEFAPVAFAIAQTGARGLSIWLEEAFGFEPSMVILGPNDELMRSEMRFGDGLVMVGSEWRPMHKS